MLYKPELINSLFEIVKQFVWEGGGDGDGWIISPYYVEYADLFEKYENGLPGKLGWLKDRQDGEGIIQFSNKQESICFIGNRAGLPNWAGNIVVEIH